MPSGKDLVEGYAQGPLPQAREHDARDARVVVLADGGERGADAVAAGKERLVQAIDQGALGAREVGQDVLRHAVVARDALVAQGGDGAHELDREVLRDGVEQLSVGLAQGVGALPPDQDHRDDVAAKPYGHHDEARERGQVARRDATALARGVALDEA